MNECLESLIKKLLEEHHDLNKLNKNILSNKSNNEYYNELIMKIKSNFVSKNNISDDDFKQFKEFINQELSMLLNPISEELTSGDCNKEKSNKNDLSFNLQRQKSVLLYSRKSDNTYFNINKDINLLPTYTINDRNMTMPTIILDLSVF